MGAEREGAETERAENRGERERSGERRSQKSMERERSAERSGELRSGNGAESGLNRALKDRSEVEPTVALYKSAPVVINLNFDELLLINPSTLD